MGCHISLLALENAMTEITCLMTDVTQTVIFKLDILALFHLEEPQFARRYVEMGLTLKPMPVMMEIT
jgi:hypothetical protein